jgi:arsenate reductase
MMKILILCTGNSARSQMGEGLLRSLSKGAIEAHSAGTHPSRLNPLAIEAMREVGIDISGHRSKSVEEFAGQRFDVVITVCDRARESCPIFPGAPERLHWSYPDPAAADGSHEEKLRAFRDVRDDLRLKLQSFLESHTTA